MPEDMIIGGRMRWSKRCDTKWTKSEEVGDGDPSHFSKVLLYIWLSSCSGVLTIKFLKEVRSMHVLVINP